MVRICYRRCAVVNKALGLGLGGPELWTSSAIRLGIWPSAHCLLQIYFILFENFWEDTLWGPPFLDILFEILSGAFWYFKMAHCRFPEYIPNFKLYGWVSLHTFKLFPFFFSLAIRYCEKCQLIKPDRAHHCSACDRWVLLSLFSFNSALEFGNRETFYMLLHI